MYHERNESLIRHYNSRFTVLVGNIFILAAWADEKIYMEEAACLKDLLFQLPELTPTEWQEMRQLLKEPLTHDQRRRILIDLVNYEFSEVEVLFILRGLDQMAYANGSCSNSKKTKIIELKKAVAADSKARIQAIAGTLFNPLSFHGEIIKGQGTPLDNLVQYVCSQVITDLKSQKILKRDIPEMAMPVLCLAGLLLCRLNMAHGSYVSCNENQVIKILQKNCKLPVNHARLTARIASIPEFISLDIIRISRLFNENTCQRQRLCLLETAFLMARLDGKLDEFEFDELMNIAASIHLDQLDFHQVWEKTTTRRKRSMPMELVAAS